MGIIGNERLKPDLSVPNRTRYQAAPRPVDTGYASHGAGSQHGSDYGGLADRPPAAASIDGRARIGDWGTTASGKQFWPQDPRLDDIELGDIAHGLAFQCRFAGATWAHYSIAQHSVLVSQACKPENAVVGLLHDATEAYLQDIIKPLKRALPGYAALERPWAICIGLVYGLGDKLVELPQDVHAADRMVYAAEWRDLMPSHATSKLRPDEPRWPDRIYPWPAERAKAEFLRRFRVLGGSR